MKIGYIGLGLMGRPCAMHLHNAGYQLALYARRPETLLPFEGTGATVCMNPAAGVAEAFCLADAMSVDKSKVREALMGGFARSRILEEHGQRMIDENYAPGFKAGLHHKDMAMVLQTAGALGVALPGTAINTQWLSALVGQGDSELDSSALYKVVKKLNVSA